VSLLIKAIADFLGLTDTPAAYTGEAGKLPKVNVGEDALEFATVAAAVGGLYGINVETLTGDKTLTPGTDKIYQYLDEGGAGRTITLATVGATAGDRFVIRHNGVFDDANILTVKQGVTTIDRIFAGSIKKFIFNGTDWVAEEMGTGENNSRQYNVGFGYGVKIYGRGASLGYEAHSQLKGVAVGYDADGKTEGVAVGYVANGYSYGVAVGYIASGYSYGVGIGYNADGHNHGIAIGYEAKTDAKNYSIALLHFSKCYRIGETSTSIGYNTDQKDNVVQGRWKGTTTDNTPVEIYCAGFGTNRFTIRPSSVLAFNMIIVARDNVGNEVARYSVHDGLIKRDGADNTSMVLCTVTVDFEDDATWDVAITADDPNEALIITVTGDGANPTQWVAVLDGVETHF